MTDSLLFDMVTEDGMWNLELFRVRFPKDRVLFGLECLLIDNGGYMEYKRQRVIGYNDLLQKKRYKNVSIHMDSLEFIKVLQISCLASLSSALIRRIHFFLQTIFQWKIKCIPRERNKVDDRLAKVASDRNTEVQVFVNFPEETLDEFGFHKVVEFPFVLI
ncbi:hypothetical protein Gotur_028210 [Gossypium turneri]